ncbi:MAG: calcium/sodium antiporter [Gammaproteobacteria bacterium]|nr:calcium/sodium antiporter [Gammaproteobacteria bacterium]
MLPALLLCAMGLVLLTFGAELLVRGGVNLGLRLGLSPLVAGLTIVAFGTSMPELAVSLNAALQGSTDVSVGNVVGSNIANIGLILGLAAVIRPMHINVRLIRVDVPLMIAVSVLFCLLMFDGELSRVDGLLLFAGIIAFTTFSVLSARRARASEQSLPEHELPQPTGGVLWNAGLVAAGLAALIFGARQLVDGAVDLARLAGVSEATIGLTIVAVGTSLPELATSVVAALKRMGDIAIGNIVGSNICNILCILGVSASIVPLPRGAISWFDLGVMVLFALTVLPFVRSRFTLQRWEGGLLLLGYGAYVARLAGNA